MMQILYENDHRIRGEQLCKVNPGSHIGEANKKPIAKPGLDTLTFWGHGGSTFFCKYSPKEFIEYVTQWKKENKSLKTIEMITCNARHAVKGQGFVSEVKRPLQKKYKDLVFKALPMGMGPLGHSHTCSILVYGDVSREWFYVTAGGTTETDMFLAKNMVMAEVKKLGITQERLIDASKIVIGREKSRKFGLEYGHLNTLRDRLIVIKN